LISLALCADAVIGNLQEKAMKMHSGSNLEMIFYSYSIGEQWVRCESLGAVQVYTDEPGIFLGDKFKGVK